MTRSLFAALAMIVTAPLYADTAPIAGTTWVYDARESIVGHPVPMGAPEAARGVLIALGSGKIQWVDASGKLVREFRMDETPAAEAVAGDLNHNGRWSIVAMDAWGSVYCFDAESGTRKWKYGRESNAQSYRLPVLADVDGDGQWEVLVSDSRGRMIVLDAGGKVKLEIAVTNYRLSPPAVADVDGDGVNEILFGTEDNQIYCIDARGELRWVTTADGRFGRTLPVIADVNGDGRKEVYVSSAFTQARPGLFAFDAATGKALWKAESKLQSYQSIAIADLNGDGHNQILYGDKSTSLFAVTADGKPVWSAHLDGRGLFFAPAIGELDGTGKATVFTVIRGAGAEGHSLYALDAKGQLLQAVDLPGGGTASPELMRFEDDRELRLIAVGGAGKLVCFRVRQDTAKARVLWPNPGLGQARGGKSAPTATSLPPPERRYAWHGTNNLNLKKVASNATAVVRLVRPDGSVQTRMLRFGPGLPQPPLKFESEASGDYDLTVRWIGEGVLPETEHSLVTVPANDWKDVDRQYRYEPKVEALREAIPDRAAMLDYIIATTRGMLDYARLRRDTRTFDRAADERHELLSLAEYVSRTKPQGNILATQMDNPWTRLDANEYYGSLKRVPSGVKLRMAGNEYESTAVVVTNLKPETVTLRFAAGDFAATDGTSVAARQVLALHEVPAVLPESTGMATEDVLPRLAEGGLLRLGPLETRKLWLVFHSAALKAGRYQSTLRAGDIASTEIPTAIPMEVEVLPVRLPEVRTYQHGNWLYLASIADEELRRATMKDALEHGTNVFHVPAATVQVDAAGAITGSESKMHDWLVKELRGRAFFLIGGSVNVAWPKGSSPSKELAEKTYAAAIRWYARYMESLGVTYSDYALYIKDEPGLMGHDADYVAWMEGIRRIKAVDPRMQLYANPAGGARAEILEEIAGSIDIWQPDLHLYREQSGPLGKMFGAKTWWHYEAPADQRNLDPLGYYRMKPWVAFGLGMTGGGYWVYSYSDFWWFDHKMSTEYGTVYQTPEGPVTTKRWEASRDGAEDFELLWQLKKLCQGRQGAQAAEARKVLEEAVAFVTAGQEHVTDISRQIRLYTPAYAKWMEHRARVMEAIMHLQENR